MREIRLKLLPHQRALFRSKSKKVLLLCGRGAGKSYALGSMALRDILSGKNIIIGGQRYETLHDTLYAEIKRLASEWGIYDMIEWRESPMQMRLNGHFGYFGTYASVDASRGYTNVSKIILDELFLAPPDILSIWGPCMRGPDVRDPQVVGATTPRMDSLWNVIISDTDCDWEIIRARTSDNKFITQEQLDLIRSGIRTDEMMRQELEGEIIIGSNASAIIRLEDFTMFPADCTDKRVVCGLDCAEGVERDSTAFAARQGNKVLDLWKLNGISHEETVNRIRDFNRRTPIDKLNMDMAFSDYEYNILKYEINCEQVQFARAATEENRELYANVRAEFFFNLAWQIKHGLCVEGFQLTPELKRQACALSWKKNNQGRLLITPKEELRLALNMSTDILDALGLTCLEKWEDAPAIATSVQRNVEKARRYARMMG